MKKRRAPKRLYKWLPHEECEYAGKAFAQAFAKADKKKAPGAPTLERFVRHRKIGQAKMIGYWWSAYQHHIQHSPIREDDPEKENIRRLAKRVFCYYLSPELRYNTFSSCLPSTRKDLFVPEEVGDGDLEQLVKYLCTRELKRRCSTVRRKKVIRAGKVFWQDKIEPVESIMSHFKHNYPSFLKNFTNLP